MQRHAFGIIGIIFLTVWAYSSLQAEQVQSGSFVAAMAIRVGLVLVALWWAYPELSRVPRWMYGVLLAGMVIIMIQPRMLVLVVPAVIAIWLLRPRSESR